MSNVHADYWGSQHTKTLRTRHLLEPTDPWCQGISAPRIVNQIQYQNIAACVSYTDKSSLVVSLDE